MREMVIFRRFGSFLLVVLICCARGHAQTASDGQITKLNADLAQAYAARKYDDALVAAKKLVEASKQRYGKNDIAVARALKVRGRVENAKGDWFAGVNSFKEAAEIFKKQADLSKEDGISFAGVLEAIADFQTADLIAAEKNLKLALRWRESSNGADAPETARTMGDLANVKFLEQDYKAASELNKQSLLFLLRNPVDWTRDLRIVTYYRTQCSYRKAKIEDRFEALKKEYEDQIGVYSKDSIEKIPKAGVLNEKALSLGQPTYPTEARRFGVSGSVRVETLISEKGEVLAACATADSDSILALSAERAAYRSQFSPTMINGLATKIAGIITYNFAR